MSTMESQIISLTIVNLSVYSGADQRKTSKLRVNALCKGEFTDDRWIPFNDVIMNIRSMNNNEWDANM